MEDAESGTAGGEQNEPPCLYQEKERESVLLPIALCNCCCMSLRPFATPHNIN